MVPQPNQGKLKPDTCQNCNYMANVWHCLPGNYGTCKQGDCYINRNNANAFLCRHSIFFGLKKNMGIPVRDFIQNKVTHKRKWNSNKRVWNLGSYGCANRYMWGFKHCAYYDIINLMLIASFVTSLLGILVFLFLFWKRLRDDYAPEIIFKTAFFVLIGTSLGYFSFWFAIVGGLIGLGISVWINKVKFYEIFEALTIAAIPWIGLLFLANSVVKSSLISFFGFLAMLVFAFIFYYLDLHYKNFTWYKSGRIGFSGLATSCLFFIVRIILAISKINVISFLSLRIEIILSAGAAIICLVLLINLANGKK